MYEKKWKSKEFKCYRMKITIFHINSANTLGVSETPDEKTKGCVYQ